jgi:hypothetical protein
VSVDPTVAKNPTPNPTMRPLYDAQEPSYYAVLDVDTDAR